MNDFIIVVNKDKGMTSFDVCKKLKKIFNTKHVGHTGTLDPNATGVLVCGINGGTKLIPYLESSYKTYECEIILGLETNTFDIWGKTLVNEEYVTDSETIDKVLNSFIGFYDQTPTMYSANKVNGKKLYEYARSGESVELEKKRVEIVSIFWDKRMEIIDKQITFKFTTKVSAGTYIRSLCHDIGERLNTHGCMKSLNRIEAGIYNIKNSFTISELEQGLGNKISLLDAIDYYKVSIDNDKLYHKVSNGMQFYLKDMMKLTNNQVLEYVAFNKEDNLIAIYKKEESLYKAVRVWKL